MDQDVRTSSKGGGSTGYDLKRTGDATVALIGLPNVGKSTLLNNLTNAKSKIASHAFTTLDVIPGMMKYDGARIQILDLPGIIKGAASGKGFGKKILSVARSADLILLMLDVFHPDQSPILRKELSQMGIRLDESPPDVVMKKKSSGGIVINTTIPDLQTDLLIKILRIYGINHAQITIREALDADQMIDIISGNRVYSKSITVVNKIDLVDKNLLAEIKRTVDSFIPISADTDLNMKRLKRTIYQRLDLIRIYMRPKGGKTDYDEPMIIQNGSRVLDVCNKVHRNLRRSFKHAYIWGKSAKFAGQKVGINHILADEDVLTIIKTKD